MKLSNFTSFSQLVDNMKQMGEDPLADAGTNVVIFRGNPDAKLMIVGEAPGPQENMEGKPFVGRAGKLLDKILRAVDFDPQEDVLITNAVFRMPPGDGERDFRKPSNQEVDHYHQYLMALIRMVDPLIILLAGNIACQSVLKETGITRLRGEWRQSHGRWIMPIFHPSYLLRNPSRDAGSPKSLMWQDIQKVRRKYDASIIGET